MMADNLDWLMDCTRIGEKATMICEFHKDRWKGYNDLWIPQGLAKRLQLLVDSKMGKKKQVDFTRLGENATMIGGFDMDQ